MDRVKLDDEKKGSVTYYMAESPYVYGERLYEMQKMQDIQIISVKANIGRKPETSWRDISTEEEYKDIIWKAKGPEVYMCVFSVVKSIGTDEDNLPVTVMLDFEKKRLTLETEPYLNAEKELHLSEFLDMLTYENYYIDKEIKKMGEGLTLVKHINNIGRAVLFIAFIKPQQGYSVLYRAGRNCLTKK